MVDGSSGEWHVREPNGSDRNFFYGNPGDIPLIGDWNCDGVETPGMFRPSTGFVYLTNGNPADNGVGTGEIFDFYERELQANGWTIDESNSADMAGSIMASKDGCKAAIFVQASPPGGSDIFVINEC